MVIPQPLLKSFQEEMLSWYAVHQRDLPWRPPSLKLRKDGTRDPYAILVSEVMSQQTQLSRVIPKYITWMQTLPTIDHLARAEQRTVLSLWSGLGYNRRGLNLQKAAQMLVSNYAGVWPQQPVELKKLPGVGEYTAAAVSCFAFDAQIPVIDTNVRKVLLLKFGEYIDKEQSEEAQIAEIAQQVLPYGKAYEWNQALMDYSALVLKKERIPVPKQSTFLGSRRSYRGKVIKLLIKHQELSFEKLWELVQDSHSKDEEWFRGILEELVRERLIKKSGDTYCL